MNWAAVAFDIASDEQINKLWPLMINAKSLWHGDMPTQLISEPYTYRQWEFNEPLLFELTSKIYDVAAMGRVWYLEALACLKMNEIERLKQSVRYG